MSPLKLSRKVFGDFSGGLVDRDSGRDVADNEFTSLANMISREGGWGEQRLGFMGYNAYDPHSGQSNAYFLLYKWVERGARRFILGKYRGGTAQEAYDWTIQAFKIAAGFAEKMGMGRMVFIGRQTICE